MRIFKKICWASLLLFVVPLVAADEESPTWWQFNAEGGYQIQLYFFYTHTCPHCQRAGPFVDDLDARLPWLALQKFAIDDDPQLGRKFSRLARSVGARASSVPAFIFCGQILTGFDDAAGVGKELAGALKQCHAQLLATGNFVIEAENDEVTYVPGWGDVDFSTWSLPAVTVSLALLDSVNPCAFFVLLVLLSMLVNAKSRWRMLLIGGVFVFFSGIIYFLFLAAWLNLFMLVGQLRWVTLLAGVTALVIGVVNAKSFFAVAAPAALSISAHAKPKLFERMRSLLGAQNIAAMLLGTVILAVFANAYELLCTAGLPMVFTRLLTMNDLATETYYGYLALYCLIYVVPLLVIVCIFAWTLGRRKLSVAEGKFLKLLSGLMMIALGTLLVAAPNALSDLGVTVGVLITVFVTAFAVNRLFGRD